MFLLKELFFLFLFLVSAAHTYAFSNTLACQALLSFSLNIQPPLNWSSTVTCCSWEGIGCDRNYQVTRLWLPSRNIHGGISPYLTNITTLTHLNLSHNFLFGPLADGFFMSLNRLEVIDLSYNHLSGQLTSDILPATIQTLDLSSNQFDGPIQGSFLSRPLNLMSFNIRNNSFTGPLPSSICTNSPFLLLFDLSLNQFTGEISRGFGKCSNLEVLRAGFNNLTGQLPNDIYRLGSLQEISFPGNMLSGQIDGGISNLTNLRILALYDNQLTGLIPRDIGKLSGLEKLFLHINNLNGTLPTSLMNCTNLRILITRVNYLVGELSSFNFSKFIHLEAIDLGDNNFSGTLPASLFLCKSLKAIRMSNNQLKGEILPEIQELKYLSFLSLSKNSLTNFKVAIRILMSLENLKTVILSKNFYYERMSNVDAEGFQNIRVLGLGGCKFRGRIPGWLVTLRKLEVLDLSFNQITGSIPGWLGTLPNLFYLDLSENLLWGGFTKELTALPRLATQDLADMVDSLELPLFVQPYSATYLQYNKLAHLPPAIYLRGNSFSGNIPIEIGRLKFIHVLDLSNNNFSGIIPDTISNLTNLEKLDLSGNHLSGGIPSSLKYLHFMSFFSIASNNLQGPIPTGGQFDTFTSLSFEGNSGLCSPLLQRPCVYQSAPSYPSTPKKGENETIILGLVIGIGFGTSFALTVTMLSMSQAGCLLINRIVAALVTNFFS